MACKSNPASGCDDSAIVAAIGKCCTSTGTKLTDINSKLATIITNNEECCTEISGKLTTIVSLLQNIAINTGGLTTTTTTAAPTTTTTTSA